MGEQLFVRICTTVVDEDGDNLALNPLCTIAVSCDVQEACDKALEFSHVATIENGSYEGMPANHFNGAGRFAIALLQFVSEAIGAQYVTLAENFTDEELSDFEEDEMDPADITITLYCNEDGTVTNNVY